MPEKLASNIAATWIAWQEAIQTALIFSIVGITIGIGQLLASKEALTFQIVVGRALSTAGLAMAAGVIFVIYPDIPKIAQLGVAALLASLGTSGIERLLQRLLGIGSGTATSGG